MVEQTGRDLEPRLRSVDIFHARFSSNGQVEPRKHTGFSRRVKIASSEGRTCDPLATHVIVVERAEKRSRGLW